MEEPEDPHSLPSEIACDVSTAPAQRGKPMSDSVAAGLFGAGSPRSAAGWQVPAPEELQLDFPQYEIVSVLGRGGMGAVYKGWQKSLERFVAIKILPPAVQDADPHFAERFKREAKAMARLSHFAICPVFDAGETSGGLL